MPLPVAQAVEAVGKRERIAQAARQLECLLIIGARLAVIAPSPQKAKGNETLPLSGKVMDRVSNLQCTLIVTACLFKFAQGFIGLSACQGDLWAGNSPQVLGGIEGARQLLDGGMRGIHRLRLFSSTLSILQSLLPGTRLKEMVGQVRQVRIERRSVEMFHHVANT